jgi:hypothetical protein
MKKSNFFKTVLGVAAAMLISSASFGQVPVPYGVFNVDPANGATHDQNTDYVTLKTGGTTMGYYALPDPVYSPNYLATGVLGGGSWAWTVPAGVAINATPSIADANYVELDFSAIGTYSITVIESAPAAMGGCPGSTTYLRTITVDPPTGTASINPGATWTAVTPNQVYQICNTQVAQTVTVAFNEAVPNGLASYAFQVTETKELLDGTGAVIATPQAETVIQNFPTGTKLKTGTVGTLPGAAFNAATPVFTYTFESDALAVMLNAGVAARTRYTYRVTRTGDATQNGFFSNISQKSDFLSALSYYNFTNQTVSFIVNPAPVTGPIYYIPNALNY